MSVLIAIITRELPDAMIGGTPLYRLIAAALRANRSDQLDLALTLRPPPGMTMIATLDAAIATAIVDALPQQSPLRERIGDGKGDPSTFTSTAFRADDARARQACKRVIAANYRVLAELPGWRVLPAADARSIVTAIDVALQQRVLRPAHAAHLASGRAPIMRAYELLRPADALLWRNDAYVAAPLGAYRP